MLFRSVISAPRPEISVYAPRIEKMMVEQDKIGAIIGKGGETINKITSETGAMVDIEDSGLVTVSGANEAIEKAVAWIKSLIEEPEVGKTYDGTVTTIKDFGAFVTILPGVDGMLHVSQISDKRIANVSDVLEVGQKVRVKLTAIDDRGRLSLTMRGVEQ